MPTEDADVVLTTASADALERMLARQLAPVLERLERLEVAILAGPGAGLALARLERLRAQEDDGR